jgi:hypothetical protein
MLMYRISFSPHSEEGQREMLGKELSASINIPAVL